MMWASGPGGECVYIHVPRTGGASVIDALRRHGDVVVRGEHVPHLSAAATATRFPATRNVPYVAVVREPCDWLVSQWSLVQHPRHHGGGHAAYGRWPEFGEYARRHCLEYPGEWRFQADFTDGGPESLELWRFDRLAAVWDRLDALLGVRLDRVHLNRGHRPAGVAAGEYYDAELRAYVWEHYARDFALWLHAVEADGERAMAGAASDAGELPGETGGVG